VDGLRFKKKEIGRKNSPPMSGNMIYVFMLNGDLYFTFFFFSREVSFDNNVDMYHAVPCLSEGGRWPPASPAHDSLFAVHGGWFAFKKKGNRKKKQPANGGQYDLRFYVKW